LKPVHLHRCGEYISKLHNVTISSNHPHSHMCGDYAAVPAVRHRRQTPLPHVWGFRNCPKGGRESVRFTPTCVGITISARCRFRQWRFTPTRVGITWYRLVCWSFSPGSPPHAWGLRACDRPAALPARFTPTRVGITLARIKRALNDFGSPPHAWGLRRVPDTPLSLVPVHPHTRGDYDKRPAREGYANPSVHPHTRGDYAINNMREESPARFTPTRVGITSTFSRRTNPTTVHPHTRGDYCFEYS